MYSTNIWHPCTQMKDFEQCLPIDISKTEGGYIYTNDNKKIFDAISSWWCKSLGHRHPYIVSKLKNQLDKYEHTIFANTKNSEIDSFSQRICKFTNMDKTLYASDGSCAVEIALKMTIHLRSFQGQKNKTKFVCLKNSYHGETLATMSVSDCGLYSKPYSQFLFESIILEDIPYITGKNDPLWNNADAYWLKSKRILEENKENINALIVEPICQGAGGMMMYSKDYLGKLCQWCNQNDIYVIFDEIMTGFGRLGKLFAYEYLDSFELDFLCISKGLTSGVIPFSVTLTKNKYYDQFYNDSISKAFLHSHTHSGNVLGAVVANAVLDIYRDEKILDNISKLEQQFSQSFGRIKKETGFIKNIRNMGGIIAADLDTDIDRFGFKVYQEALKLGGLLRPLGNTVYWLPPLNSTIDEILTLEQITKKAIINAMKSI
ncbi:adenosylmethionine--8-amino-7-oxononanoate transaminase [Francisella adeliensis]|uniref:Adenosylmethionine-8-amino-7-oxononanoate aminotransferase n=1 Tax=Francisella adeliensis TaxID=2007306 RepID=A0A2Z4Y0Q5_9GAMM|nr:adenosylmethionine--8-amino-7-oxononanoate transaminase [Francisella adeliensis]AXA34650.1 adenosylmethionine--8-amino-7-oxononanoate transaminase [Francisella adeliensis]MBK2086377.1 adenosylmethionine--8-amino-7-oxononanoate transaminase [Francisella adeliensis]MBK2096592.1 adenosylmethionine--8-amino-7-oxononanoate transaminase [Francisella adeliensis]QIW12894.1 adenosylmethionine--8-amino-7-oxononanoate transaminase [Francisella adeliensis]QIW14770.1 adenosylmethionine--8-amino-7-oxonon